MASAVNFSGLASGIDSSSLIKSILDQQRKSRITPLQNQITELSDTNDSFSKLKTLLSTLKDKASAFRALNGGSIAKVASSSDDSVLSATSTNGASAGSYTVSVSQLAKSGTYSFASTAGSYTSGSDVISGGSSFSDTVVVAIGDPLDPVDTVSIDVNQNTTLNSFVSSFNADTSNATASLVNVGSVSAPNYKIVINSAKTGTEEGALTVTVGATLSGRSAFDSNTNSAATDAIFSVAGLSGTITRSSNTVTDVFADIALKINDTGSARLQVGIDGTTSASTLRDFVDSYNEVVSYISSADSVTQEKDGNETKNIFGPLARSSLDDNVLSSLRSAFSSSSLSGNAVNTLADLGISTNRDGTLAFNEDDFQTALASDSSSVSSILQSFGETLASTDGTIAQFTRFNGLIDLSYNSNGKQVTDLNSRIGELEASLSREQESLTKRFSALEVYTGKLQSAQAALASMGVR